MEDFINFLSKMEYIIYKKEYIISFKLKRSIMEFTCDVYHNLTDFLKRGKFYSLLKY